MLTQACFDCVLFFCFVMSFVLQSKQHINVHYYYWFIMTKMYENWICQSGSSDRVCYLQLQLMRLIWAKVEITAPSFLLLGRKMDLTIPQWSTLRSEGRIIDHKYRFCDDYFCTCFCTDVCCFRSELIRTKLRLLHDYSDGKQHVSGRRKQIKKWSRRRNGNYNRLFGCQI